tara:strand:- start:2028 stop:2300 length:273 start_codon:yes stop_codon:yes gene_type:complete
VAKSRIDKSVFSDIDTLDVQSIDVERACGDLNFMELVVLIKDMEGYSGVEIADLFRDVTGRGSKQRVNAIRRNIRKKFLARSGRGEKNEQ